jgi:hypothetical protein
LHRRSQAEAIRRRPVSREVNDALAAQNIGNRVTRPHSNLIISVAAGVAGTINSHCLDDLGENPGVIVARKLPAGRRHPAA